MRKIQLKSEQLLILKNQRSFQVENVYPNLNQFHETTVWISSLCYFVSCIPPLVGDSSLHAKWLITHVFLQKEISMKSYLSEMRFGGNEIDVWSEKHTWLKNVEETNQNNWEAIWNPLSTKKNMSAHFELWILCSFIESNVTW